MSDTPPTNPGAEDPAARPEREASLNLGGPAQLGEDPAALMDPANRSLAEALRISFLLVQGAMVVLALLFLFSGVQQVESNEEGINVLFGKKRASDLQPGFHLSAPYPLGELLKIDTSPMPFEVGMFFPALREGQTPEEVAEQGSLGNPNPPADGLLITSDLNIVHAYWTANYRRAQPDRSVELFHPDHEQRIVAAMLERSVVHAVGETTLTAMLRGEAVAGLQREVQNSAQAAIDELAAADETGVPISGVEIDQVRATNRTPPLSLKQRFAAVLTAESAAGQARNEAETTRAETLNGIAGRAAPVLIQQIDRYERAIETGDAAGAERILEVIDAVLAGEPVEIEGQLIDRLVSGEVSQLLSEAERLRFTLASAAESQARLFEAKLAQFEANPRLTLARDWAASMTAFLDKPFVQPMYMPPGQTQAQLIINEDPDIVREMIRAQNAAEAREALEERERRRQQGQFELERGVNRAREG